MQCVSIETVPDSDLEENEMFTVSIDTSSITAVIAESSVLILDNTSEF